MFVLASAGFFIAALLMPTFDEYTQFTTPATFPKMLSGFFLFISLGHLLYTIRKNKEGPRSSQAGIGISRRQAVLLFILTCYLILLPMIHFILSTILFMVILTFYLLPADAKKKGMIIGVSITAVLLCLIYYLFEIQLNVSLP